MSDLVDYYDNVVAHLAADATLPELTAKRILLVTGPDDDAQIKSIEEHIKNAVMLTKGIGVVIFEAGGENDTRDSLDVAVHSRLAFEVRLMVHPQKWGPKYDPTRRKAREILVALVKSLNGAEIAPARRGCHERTRVLNWSPVADPDFWAWNIECDRIMKI